MYDTNISISTVKYYVEYERQEKKKIDSDNCVHDVTEENQDRIGKNSSSMKWKKYLY